MVAHLIWGMVKAGSLELTCPHCGRKQLRARHGHEHGERYRCAQCHKLFGKAEGEKARRTKK
jgi:transposase-like protein